MFGIYIYDNTKGIYTFEQNNDLFTELGIPIVPDLSKDNLISTLLSLFIKTYFNNEQNNNKSYTIFITSCREYSDDTTYTKYNNKLIFYERMIKSLNFKLHNDKNKTNKGYNKNIILNSYANCKGKITNFTRQSTFTQKIKNTQMQKQKQIKSSNNIVISDDSKIMLNNSNNNNNLNNKYKYSEYIQQNNDNNNFIYLKNIKTILNKYKNDKIKLFNFITPLDI